MLLSHALLSLDWLQGLKCLHLHHSFLMLLYQLLLAFCGNFLPLCFRTPMFSLLVTCFQTHHLAESVFYAVNYIRLCFCSP
jgi:hypothetical protein